MSRASIYFKVRSQTKHAPPFSACPQQSTLAVICSSSQMTMKASILITSAKSSRHCWPLHLLGSFIHLMNQPKMVPNFVLDTSQFNQVHARTVVSNIYFGRLEKQKAHCSPPNTPIINHKSESKKFLVLSFPYPCSHHKPTFEDLNAIGSYFFLGAKETMDSLMSQATNYCKTLCPLPPPESRSASCSSVSPMAQITTNPKLSTYTHERNGFV